MNTPIAKQHNSVVCRNFTAPSMLSLLAALLTTLAGMSVSNGQSTINLGLARNYAVLGKNLNFSNVSVYGDVGVSPSGYINVMSPSSISGALYLGSGATKSIIGQVNGTIYQPYSLDSAIASATSAANTAAGLTPNVTYSSVTTPLTISALSAQTVVNITGSINLSGSNNLYFTGAAGSKFIVNVFGGFTLGGSSVIGPAPGSAINASDILINIVGTGAKVTTKIGNSVMGTILGPSRQYELHSVSGAVIGGSLEMKLMSDCVITYKGFDPLPAPVAIPVGSLTISRNVAVKGYTIPVGYSINRNGGS